MSSSVSPQCCVTSVAQRGQPQYGLNRWLFVMYEYKTSTDGKSAIRDAQVAVVCNPRTTNSSTLAPLKATEKTSLPSLSDFNFKLPLPPLFSISFLSSPLLFCLPPSLPLLFRARLPLPLALPRSSPAEIMRVYQRAVV